MFSDSVFSGSDGANWGHGERGGEEWKIDEFRMQNGGRKVAISGAPIDAQGYGLSPAESGSEHGIVSRGGHTGENHLLPSSSIGG